MKKKYILLLLIIINIVGIRYINSVSYFPEKITLYRHKVASRTSDPSGITIDSNRIVNKTYEATVDGVKIGGRAFCSGWKYNVPLYWIECEKKAWVNDEDENKKVSASIGQFIYDLRGVDGISERDYFYGEMAINDFLYQKYKDDVNYIRKSFNASNIKISETYRKKIENYYNNYGKNTSVKIMSVKVNNTDITKANATLNVAENYQLKILVKCSDDNCKNFNVEAKDIKVNGAKINAENVSISKNNNDNETITVNIPNNIINSGVGEKNTVNISLNKKIETYLAQRYGCGEGKYRINYQPVVPNMLVPNDYSISLNWDGSFSIENKSEESCEQKITHNTPAQNAELYATEYPSFSKLLDINDASCDEISNNPGKNDCENTDMSYNWVDTVKINNINYYEYCSASFKFENIAVKDNWGKLGGKIYKTENGVVGYATVTYDCNVPSLYNEKNIKHNIAINKSLLAPKLYMRVDKNPVEIKSEIKTVDNYNDVELCSKNNDKVSCENYAGDTKNGFGWIFTATIEYKYPTNMNGFDIPSDAEVSDNNTSTIEFDLTGTTFEKVELDEKNKKCNYGVKSGENVLYRTINYNKPFADYSGNNRKTGSNWCYSGAYELNSNSCLLLGDVDNDGALTQNDEYLIGNYASEKDSINVDCADVNRDGVVDVNDVTELQRKMRSAVNDSNYGDISEDEDGSDGCEGDNPKVQKYIMQRPNANGKYKTVNNVEKSVDGPLYSIKLTSSEIKKIRSSNKNQGGYNSYSSSINEFIGTYIGAENVQGLCKSSIDGNTNCDIDNVWKKV